MPKIDQKRPRGAKHQRLLHKEEIQTSQHWSVGTFLEISNKIQYRNVRKVGLLSHQTEEEQHKEQDASQQQERLAQAGQMQGGKTLLNIYFIVTYEQV